MELVILKNGEIFTRTIVQNDDSEYTFEVLNDAPSMPITPPDVGKEWTVAFIDGVLTWVQTDRPLTIEERMNAVEEKQNAWKPDEVVNVGDRRYYHEAWYTCIQYHTTQADWEPDITPALWRAD